MHARTRAHKYGNKSAVAHFIQSQPAFVIDRQWATLRALWLVENVSLCWEGELFCLAVHAQGRLSSDVTCLGCFHLTAILYLSAQSAQTEQVGRQNRKQKNIKSTLRSLFRVVAREWYSLIRSDTHCDWRSLLFIRQLCQSSICLPSAVAGELTLATWAR